MDFRRKKLKRLLQLQAKSTAAPSNNNDVDALLPSEADLIWWVSSGSSSSSEDDLLPGTWLKDRLTELSQAEDAPSTTTNISALETKVRAALRDNDSNAALGDALLDLLGYSDYAMSLLPELIANRTRILRAANNKKKPQQQPTSFIKGATLGGGGDPHQRSALPSGSTREWCDVKSGGGGGSSASTTRCEVVTVPAAQPAPLTHMDVLVPTSRFGKVSRQAFAGVDSLNRLQSRVFSAAYETNENLLIVAPTGAGKTLVAMTCIAREIETKSPLGVKCVYIAPMKALAQEVVQKFQEKLGGPQLRMTVKELTGDTQLTRQEMEHTQIIVSTPEKWDVISRKGGELVEMVSLLIIDEVHLVGDDRGPVVEALVARTVRQVERRQQMVRIVGLSATLPNYLDLAVFLRVNPDRGLFYFASSYRPVPLEQRFVGVTLQDALPPAASTSTALTPQEERAKQKQAMKSHRQLEQIYNQLAFDYASECVSRGHQVLVFVHTRKDTSKTARALLEIASTAKKGTGGSRIFVTGDGEQGHPALAKRVALSRNQDVRSLFTQGLGVHHAGMAREDRSLTEELFTKGAISVLCCTSTLAWGVNLPSHLVIVKGTQIYAPERGGVCELNSADVFQCFGRAGRPQYDTSGEAVLITEHSQLPRYLAMLTHSLPLESKLIKGLPDALNAEIVGGTVATVEEASTWLSYTFLFVRMLKSPTQYGVSLDTRREDPELNMQRLALVSQAVRLLAAAKMVRLGSVPGGGSQLPNRPLPPNTPLGVTDLGRVACNYYVAYETVETLFNKRIHGDMTMTELLDAVCGSKEFEDLKLREEEMPEIRKLSAHACPFELERVEDARNPFDTPRAKAFILLQTYISRYPVEQFTLFSDMNYTVQNAARITRALFEVAVSKRWLNLALQTLQLSTALERRAWWSPMQHPLRQLCPVHAKPEFVYLLEDGGGSALDDNDWSVDRLLAGGEQSVVAELVQRFPAINAQQAGRLVQACRLLPRCRVDVVQRQPINSSLLRLVVNLTPLFEWRERVHGQRQSYHLFVDDGETVLHSERVTLLAPSSSSAAAGGDGVVQRTLVVPLFGGPANEEYNDDDDVAAGPAEYYIRLESDSGWLDVGHCATVSLAEMQLPSEAPQYFTELLPLDPLPMAALKHPVLLAGLAACSSGGASAMTHFNPIQTQCFHALYYQQHSLVISAPTGSGKTVLAELAMWQVLFGGEAHQPGSIVYIAPMKALVSERVADWERKFRFWNKSIVELTGDSSASQHHLRNAALIVATPEKFEVSTRFYKEEEDDHFLSRVRLVVFDEIHLLGEERGAALEAIVSRLKQLKRGNGTGAAVRMLGLSATLANPVDVCRWFNGGGGGGGEEEAVVYNFRPAVRPVPLEVHIAGFPGSHYCPRMATMNKPIYSAIQQHAEDKPVLVFVASRRQTRLTALDLISLCSDNPHKFLRAEIDVAGIDDEAFRHCAQFGIALHHAGLSKADRERAELLFSSGACQVLVATATLAWGVNLPSHLVVVKGTEYFDAKSRTYLPFPVSDVLQMMGRAGRVQFGEDKGVAVLLVHDQLKPFYKRFLYEPFPLESNLAARFASYLNVEICTGRVRSLATALEYLASTFLAVRVERNPVYYADQEATGRAVANRATGGARAYFSRLVHTRLRELVEAECCGEDFTARPLGLVAAKFDLLPESVKWMHDCVVKVKPSASSSLVQWVLETVTQTKDFADVPVRANEDELNRVLAGGLEFGSGAYKKDGLALPNCKAFLLLQARLQRVKLPIHDYVTDSRQVEDLAARALPALVAVCCAGEGPLQVCIDAWRVMAQLEGSSKKAASTAAPMIRATRTAERTVRCELVSSGGGGDAWWCLVKQDRVLAVQRHRHGRANELVVPPSHNDSPLQVCLVCADGAQSAPVQV